MPDLEAQNTPKNFDLLSSSLADQLYEASTKVNSVQKLLARQKARKNSAKLDYRILDLVEEAAPLLKAARASLQTLLDWDEKALSKQQVLSQERLQREFSQLLKQFQGQQRDLAEVQRVVLIEAQKDSSASSEQTPLLAKEAGGSSHGDETRYESLSEHLQHKQPQEQQQQMLDVVRQEDVDFQQSLIQERDLEIRTIQEGIAEINAIFKDLGTLVTQQGEQIDSVEDNVTDMAANTRSAVDELVSANEYQRKKRNWSMCVLAVLIIVLVVILLALTV